MDTEVGSFKHSDYNNDICKKKTRDLTKLNSIIYYLGNKCKIGLSLNNEFGKQCSPSIFNNCAHFLNFRLDLFFSQYHEFTLNDWCFVYPENNYNMSIYHNFFNNSEVFFRDIPIKRSKEYSLDYSMIYNKFYNYGIAHYIKKYSDINYQFLIDFNENYKQRYNYFQKYKKYQYYIFTNHDYCTDVNLLHILNELYDTFVKLNINTDNFLIILIKKNYQIDINKLKFKKYIALYNDVSNYQLFNDKKLVSFINENINRIKNEAKSDGVE